MSTDPFARRTFLSRALLGVGASAVSFDAHAAAGPGDRDVRSFGAKGDGRTLDTPAINLAIQTAAKAGGGTVRFPAGTYLCYSIHLASKVALYLDPGSTIFAAEPPLSGASGGYDDAEPMAFDKFQDFGHSHFHNSLIWGEGLEDIAILGPGLIWGKGLSKGYGSERKPEEPHVGNKAISLKNCRNVTLRDLSILKGGHFGILATGVDNFTIDSVKIDTDRDGIDIDCCRNVRISNCSVNSPWDDAICLKSSFGLGYARATEMVTITNCQVSGSFALGSLLDGSFKPLPAGQRIPRTGRIKFGTESNGGFKNVAVSNCVCDGCQGIALETVDGGIFEDVSITNITMRDITSAPLFLRLGSRMRGPAGVPVGVFRRVLISNIVCSNSASRFGCVMSGIPGHPIEDVKISNIYIQHGGGGTHEAADIHPPEREDAYPEPNMFGDMPSHGFYLRHVKGIELSNVEVETLKPDLRPLIVMDDVQNADLFRVKAPRLSDMPVLAMSQVRNLSVAASRPLIADTHIDHMENGKL